MSKKTTTSNLLSDAWVNIEQYELMFIIKDYIGGPGQYEGRLDNPNKFYLPLAGSSCKIALSFRKKKIIFIEPGTAFDPSEWKQIIEEIDSLLHARNVKIGREYSFSSFRVVGSWRGERSKVQILPPPDDAPRAPVEMAENPFILEFPLVVSNKSSITNYRRQIEHRKLTFLLNILLAGRTNLQPRQSEHFWASVSWDVNQPDIRWVQQFFFAKLGKIVIDELSPENDEGIEEVESEEYYTKVGHDGKSLRVPNDLDESICHYLRLSPKDRLKFDRAAFWMDMTSRQWNISVSASFAALVSAIESLINIRERGSTKRFVDFLEKYSPGTSLKNHRNDMYDLRSGILHGSELMQIDQDIASGWDPPNWNEYELHNELWGLTRIALRNWMKNPS